MSNAVRTAGAQRIFGQGAPDEARAEVRKRIADLAPTGDFVFATVHDAQANVPRGLCGKVGDTPGVQGLLTCGDRAITRRAEQDRA